MYGPKEQKSINIIKVKKVSWEVSKFVIAEEKWRILDRMRDILINNYTTSFPLGEEMDEMPLEIEEVSTDTDDDLPSLIVE